MNPYQTQSNATILTINQYLHVLSWSWWNQSVICSALDGECRMHTTYYPLPRKWVALIGTLGTLCSFTQNFEYYYDIIIFYGLPNRTSLHRIETQHLNPSYQSLVVLWWYCSMRQLWHIQLTCKLLRFLYLQLGIPEAGEGGKGRKLVLTYFSVS